MLLNKKIFSCVIAVFKMYLFAMTVVYDFIENSPTDNCQLQTVHKCQQLMVNSASNIVFRLLKVITGVKVALQI